jgi:hypothetical protein
MMKDRNLLRSLIFLAMASVSATVLAAPAGAKPGVSNMGRMGGVPPAGAPSHGGGGQPHGGGGQPQGGGHGYGNSGHGYYGHGYYGHGHGYYGRGYGFGVYLGAPFYSYPYYYPYYPYNYYPYPYYGYPYYPPVVVETVPAEPPVYIEQGTPQFSAPQEQPQPENSNWWYHCAKPDGYYPYVKTCPSGWEKVKPLQPPQQ